MRNFKITFREHISGLSWISKTGSKVDAELSIFDKRSELKFYKVSRSDPDPIRRRDGLSYYGKVEIRHHSTGDGDQSVSIMAGVRCVSLCGFV